MRSSTEIVTSIVEKRLGRPASIPVLHDNAACVFVRAGMAEALREVVERQKKCELEYGGVMPPQDDPRHEGWCVYCWATAELAKLKGER